MMDKVVCHICNSAMTPCKSEENVWYFGCSKRGCQGARRIYFSSEDARMIVAAIDRLTEQLKPTEDRESALRESVQHVKKLDTCVADYWKGRAR